MQKSKSQSPLSVVILAAGAGSRMKSNTPKPLYKILGKSMSYYLIDHALNLGAKVHIVVGHQGENVQSSISANYKSQCENEQIKFYAQDIVGRAGSGGAMMDKALIDDLENEVLVLCSDTPLIKLQSLINLRMKLASSDGVVASFPLAAENMHLAYGRLSISDGVVLQIIEQKDLLPSQTHLNIANAGVYCFCKSLIENCIFDLKDNNNAKEYYLTDIVQIANTKGYKIINLEVNEDEFMGINSKYQLHLATKILSDRIQKSLMEAGVEIEENVLIESDVEIVGECKIQSGVILRSGTKIIESEILSHSVIEGALIKNSTIGPFARVRPFSEIIDAKVGNFVEVKNSKITGAKASHLSYLGDCEIDCGTNIGAGVITCNYDGKTKHKTKIGKNVFVGSDSQLIAPLEIPDDVLIASGTTITRDPAKGDLVISRTKEQNKSNFYYAFFRDRAKKED